jgi:hypothetical protein
LLGFETMSEISHLAVRSELLKVNEVSVAELTRNSGKHGLRMK